MVLMTGSIKNEVIKIYTLRKPAQKLAQQVRSSKVLKVCLFIYLLIYLLPKTKV